MYSGSERLVMGKALCRAEMPPRIARPDVGWALRLEADDAIHYTSPHLHDGSGMVPANSERCSRFVCLPGPGR